MNRPRPSRAELLEQMRGLICEQCGVNARQVRSESRLVDDLGIDSLDMVELVMAVEEAFDVTIPDQDSERNPVLQFAFTKPGFTVGDFVDLIHMQWDDSPRIDRKPATDASVPSLAAFSQLDGVFDPKPRPELFFEPLIPNEQGHLTMRRWSDGMVSVTIPASSVKIGGKSREIAAFAIDIEPVSTTAYARFLNSIGPIDAATEELWFALLQWDNRRVHLPLRRDEGDKNGRWRPHPGTETWPMMLVSWFGANAYALWANGYAWQNYRQTSPWLPSNAQFQHAARGPKPALFPWGNEPATPQRANLARHEYRKRYALENLPLTPVNAHQGLSPFGLRHMAGNVWQWMRNWYDDAHRIRCERGGSWIASAELGRCDYHRGRPPHAKGRCLGFRCVSPALAD